MLVETYKELPMDLVASARPIPIKHRSRRDMQVIKIVNDSTVETFSGLVQVISFRTILDLLRGNNTVASGLLVDFHKLLTKFCNYRILFRDRVLYYEGYEIYLRDKIGAFFVIRHGNMWGSLYLIDEDSSIQSVYNRVSKFLSRCAEAGWNIDRLMPPARMAEHLFRDKVRSSFLPNISGGDIPKHTLELFYNSFRGGRMEALKLGSFDKVYDFDFNSSHFAILREMPIVVPGFVRYVSSKQYQHDAILGACRANVYIDDKCPMGLVATKVSISNKFPRLYYNLGETIGFRTKSEIDLLIQSGYADVDILEGAWIIPERPVVKPFGEISKILEFLMSDANSKSFAKLIAATMWGKFCGAYGGPMWNPIYGAEISAQARIKITELAMTKASDVIAIAIDGLALTSPLPSSVLSDSFIGGMKMREYDKMISLSDFYRCIDSEHEGWQLSDKGIRIDSIRKTIPYIMEFGGDISEVGNKLSDSIVPYGSTKRISPKNLTLDKLSNTQYSLKPPSEEDAVMLYLGAKDIVPFDI